MISLAGLSVIYMMCIVMGMIGTDSERVLDITKTHLFKYIENFTAKKMAIFQIKKSDIFHISAQIIDCGYSLEPQCIFLSRNNKSNVYPCKPQFYYIKVGFKVVKII